MLFTKRCVLALRAIRWCHEHNVQPTPFNIVTAVDSFGLLKSEAVEHGLHPTSETLPDLSESSTPEVSATSQSES